MGGCPWISDARGAAAHVLLAVGYLIGKHLERKRHFRDDSR